MVKTASDAGIITLRSNHSVDRTVQRLEEILRARGVKLFAVIDHSGEAEKAGLRLRPTKLLIFGSPKSRHSVDGCVPDGRYRSAAEVSGLGG